ncbi:MAG: hypothetical protein K2W82_08825 [Candidatus Obscuribacterales bacterium]|nr:hypothetical protein [Candidatus Obscuribacterales bacterium]
MMKNKISLCVVLLLMLNCYLQAVAAENECDKLVEECTRLEKAGEFQKELELAERAVLLCPKNYFAHQAVESAAINLKKFQRALSATCMCIKLDPTLDVSYRKRAAVYELLNKYSLAIRDYNTALKCAYGYDAEILEERGKCKLKLGRYKSGEKDLQSAAIIYLEQHQCDKAQKCIDEYLKLLPPPNGQA